MDTEHLYCTFRVQGHLFGVDVLAVKEITTETTCTPIAHAPEEVLGLVNIRGNIYLALDVRRLLGLPAAIVTGDSRLILFKSMVGSAFGVVVDEVADIRSVASESIEPFRGESLENLTTHVQRVDLIDAVCKLPSELLVVLNPRRFLSLIEQRLSVTA